MQSIHPDESPSVRYCRDNDLNTFPGLEDRDHWLVLPISNGRDADALTRSNWRVVLADLGGESETLEILWFRHWAVGWTEVAIIHPSRKGDADGWLKALNDYPVACEEDFSALEYEEREEEGSL